MVSGLFLAFNSIAKDLESIIVVGAALDLEKVVKCVGSPAMKSMLLGPTGVFSAFAMYFATSSLSNRGRMPSANMRFVTEKKAAFLASFSMFDWQYIDLILTTLQSTWRITLFISPTLSSMFLPIGTLMDMM